MQNQEDENIENIVGIFETYDISVSWLSTSIGPVIAKYEFKLKNDKDILRYKAKKEDIFFAMKSGLNLPRVYMSDSNLHGSIIIVEVPKKEPTYVYLKEWLKDLQKEKYNLPIILGKDTEDNLIIKDLTDIPNILMAGATGTGKSVFLNSFIVTLLTTKTPDEVKLILIDPKMGMEMTEYKDIPHLLFPVAIDSKEIGKILTWCIDEMARRYNQLEHAHVNTVTEYNKALGYNAMPYIVIIVDELADLVLSGDKLEVRFQQLAEMGKDIGIHMILSTSSPSKTVFTDRLKERIPGRMAGALATKEESQRTLDQDGAEDLLGNGDLIYKNMDSGEFIRVQVPYISYEDIEEIVKGVV